jgi:hypothetical protein
MSLPECIRNLVGKWVTPPRNKIFDSNAQKYLVKKMDNHGLFVEIVFESRTALRVHYWRFNHVIDMLNEAQGSYIPVGTQINADDPNSVQGSLYQEAMKNNYPYANMRMASFVCDFIVLCGYGEYGYTVNQRTGWKVQGIRKKPIPII